MQKNKSKEKRKQKPVNLTEIVQAFYSPVKDDGSTSDVLGSYTGTPLNGEEPVQDADDL